MSPDNNEAMSQADDLISMATAAGFEYNINAAFTVRGNFAQLEALIKAATTKQAERIAELEGERGNLLETVAADTTMLFDLCAERDQLRAEVAANRELDALRIAATHIHSELRSIVQAGGSDEAIGREFRKRVLPDIEDEFVKLRAEVERLKPNAERYEWLRDNHESEWAICEWQDDPDGLGYYRDARAPEFVDAALDAARTTHKETE